MTVTKKIKSALRLRTHARKAWRTVLALAPEELRFAQYRNLIHLPCGHIPELTLKLAETKDELESALRLLHDSYVNEGLMQPHPSGMRVTAYHALPSTSTFVALWNREVVGTLSVIRDSVLGFPSDKILDVSLLRQKGARIAEPSALAIRPDFRGARNSMILYSLFKYLTEYSRDYFGIDYWVVAVNPKHAALYEAIFCFKRLQESTIDNYDYVNGAPAVGLYCDLNQFPLVTAAHYWNKPPHKNIFSFFFDTRLPNFIYPDRQFFKISDPFLTPELLDYFFRRKSDVFAKLSSDQRHVLRSLYDHEKYGAVLPLPGEAPKNFYPRNAKRFDGRCPGQACYLGSKEQIPLLVQEVSLTGFGALLDENARRSLRLDEPMTVRVAVAEFKIAKLVARPAWINEAGVCGFKIERASRSWYAFIRHLQGDMDKAAERLVAGRSHERSQFSP